MPGIGKSRQQFIFFHHPKWLLVDATFFTCWRRKWIFYERIKQDLLSLLVHQQKFPIKGQSYYLSYFYLLCLPLLLIFFTLFIFSYFDFEIWSREKKWYSFPFTHFFISFLTIKVFLLTSLNLTRFILQYSILILIILSLFIWERF